MIRSQPAGTAFQWVLPAPTVRMSWAFFSHALGLPLFAGQEKHGTGPALLVLCCTKTPLWERTLVFGCLGPFYPAWRRALPKFFYFATEHFLRRWEKHSIRRAGREEQSKPFLSSLWFRVQELSAHQAAHLHRGCRDELGEDERKIISPAFSLCYCADEIIQSYWRVAPSKGPTLFQLVRWNASAPAPTEAGTCTLPPPKQCLPLNRHNLYTALIPAPIWPSAQWQTRSLPRAWTCIYIHCDVSLYVLRSEEQR